MPRQYIDILKKALSKVEAEYFKPRTTYQPKGIVRERIFCYELYHQMRISPNNKLSLHGEIDKSGHRDFLKSLNPDFVFHAQTTHLANTLVIEVKGRIVRKEIKKDFETLLFFVGHEDNPYQAGAFVLYNHTFNDLMHKMGQDLIKFSAHRNANAIYILTIVEAETQCEEHRLTSLSASPRF